MSFITTFYYCKKYHYNEDAVRNSLTRIESMVDIPDIGKSNIHDALQSGIKDFEDATQIFCAYAGKADIIITRNKKDFAESSIPVKTPFEFLSEHEDWF